MEVLDGATIGMGSAGDPGRVRKRWVAGSRTLRTQAQRETYDRLAHEFTAGVGRIRP